MSGDADIVSHDPARPGTEVGRARVEPAAVGHAVRAARGAFPGWSALTMDERAERLRAWSAACARPSRA